MTDPSRADDSLLRAIFEGAQDAMVVADDRGRYVEANPAACTLFGLPRDQLVGRNVLEFEAEPPADPSIWQRFVDHGRMRGEFELRRADGERRLLDYDAVANVLPGLHLSILRDSTERRRAEAALQRSEAQLRQAQKMEAIGSLAGGVAHDFNNLLSVILSYTSLVLDDVKDDDPIRADLEQIQKAGARATELTKQLLAFSRKRTAEPVVLDVNQVITGVEQMLARLLGEHVEVSFVTAAQNCKVHADRAQLEQVLMNLLVNARDAMPGGGTLTIETSNVMLDETYAPKAPGQYVRIAVADTGSGMDAATALRVFEPFFTTKEKGKGTGLGLSTVYGIVQQSGGQIRVESTVGRGSTFLVYLPLTNRNLAGSDPPQELTTVRGTETILLVEDEEQVRITSAAILRKHGYTVLEAQSGSEAIALCEPLPADVQLLVTDVVMPGMSGPQVAQRLTQQRPALRVLYVSGYTHDTMVHHGVVAGGASFLAKPILPDLLLRKVRQLLDA